MGRQSKGTTKQLPIRLSDEDREALEYIQRHYHLPDLATTMRWLIGETRRSLAERRPVVISPSSNDSGVEGFD